MSAVETLVTGLNFTEGPRPDGKGNIYFTDVFGRGLYRLNADGSCDTLGPERQSPGGCVINRDGCVIYSARDGLAAYNPATDKVTPLPITIDGKPVLDINDIEADPQGNLWGGTIDHDSLEKGEPMRPGMIFRLARDGTARNIASTKLANGMEFSRDGTKLYFSETGTGVIIFDVGADGTLSGQRLAAGAMSDNDGIVMDVEGGLWVAHYTGNKIVRYAPDGKADTVIETPFTNVASVAFGGKDMKTLYIAGGSLNETGTGGLLSFQADVAGHPPFMTDLTIPAG